jgi:hypothetical protein
MSEHLFLPSPRNDHEHDKRDNGSGGDGEDDSNELDPWDSRLEMQPHASSRWIPRCHITKYVTPTSAVTVCDSALRLE